MLLDAERVQFGPVVALNPATLLPLPEEAEQHDCLQILTEVHGTRPDLSDQPLQNADHTWYTDDNSFLAEGERKARAAVTTEDKVIWAKALPAGTSAQRAELIALTQALKMTKGKRLNIYIQTAVMPLPRHTSTGRSTGGGGCSHLRVKIWLKFWPS